MKWIGRFLASGLATLLFLLASQFNHVAAMQMPHGTHVHRSKAISTSQVCATLCTTAMLKKTDNKYVKDAKDDDDLAPDIFVHQLSNAVNLDRIKLIMPYDPELPIKVPIYIQFSVFRS